MRRRVASPFFIVVQQGPIGLFGSESPPTARRSQAVERPCTRPVRGTTIGTTIVVMITMTLNARAWFALTGMAAAMGLLLFGAAGTMRYWQAWAYLAIFLGASALTTLYL